MKHIIKFLKQESQKKEQLTQEQFEIAIVNQELKMDTIHIIWALFSLSIVFYNLIYGLTTLPGQTKGEVIIILYLSVMIIALVGIIVKRYFCSLVILYNGGTKRDCFPYYKNEIELLSFVTSFSIVLLCFFILLAFFPMIKTYL